MQILLCLGPDENDNETAAALLEKLPDVHLKIMRDTAILAGYVELPYIQTEQRDRYYGMESITDFVDSILAIPSE